VSRVACCMSRVACCVLSQFRLRGFVASDFWAVCELARDAALEPDALQTDPDPGSLHAPTAGGSAAPAQEKGVVYNTVRRVLSRLPLRDRLSPTNFSCVRNCINTRERVKIFI
jgi:hypothetical protein